MGNRQLSKKSRLVRVIGGTLLTGIGMSGMMKNSMARTLTAGIGIGTMMEGLTGKCFMEILDR